MDFKKLQKMQLALDADILSQNPEMSAEERFTKTLVALSVELAEVANCAEHFKHWKINKGKVDEKVFKGDKQSGYLNINEVTHDSSGNSFEAGIYSFEQAHHLTLVEEAADCLHFILSLANQSGVVIDYAWEVEMIADRTESLEEQFIELNWLIHESYESERFNSNLVEFFLSYVHNLEITTDELEQAYYAKNEVNYQRLEEGY